MTNYAILTINFTVLCAFLICSNMWKVADKRADGASRAPKNRSKQTTRKTPWLAPSLYPLEIRKESDSTTPNRCS